jgi:hypothetical protein
MNHLRFFFAVVAGLLLASTVTAQTTPHTLSDGTVVPFPNLTITGSTVDWSVAYDATRGVYRYTYAINAPGTNLAPIHAVKIDITGSISLPQTDSSLQENITRHPARQPATTIPVGLTVPDLTWSADVSSGGNAFFHSRKEAHDVQPGSSRGGFVIESKLPPGVRNVQIIPSDQAWFRIGDQLPNTGAEFTDPPDVRTFIITTTTVAPAEVPDAALYDGGGQQPAEVNKFLRYATPLDNRIKVPANSTQLVIVYYGKTINPATFAATQDGVDITSRFHPAPGGADAVRIAVGTSTTKVHLSVDGTKSSGGKGTDSDTLTFLPQ